MAFILTQMGMETESNTNLCFGSCADTVSDFIMLMLMLIHGDARAAFVLGIDRENMPGKGKGQASNCKTGQSKGCDHKGKGKGKVGALSLKEATCFSSLS